MERRNFLVRSAGALSAGLVGGCAAHRPGVQPPRREQPPQRGEVFFPPDRVDSGSDWDQVREQFALSRDFRQFATFFLASHPRPVAAAIERHRRELDKDPFNYFVKNNGRLKMAALQDAASYLGVNPGEIALADSTTMGLGIVYGGLVLKEGQEILTTEHDHPSTHRALKYRAERTGAKVNTIRLYKNSAKATEDEMVRAIERAITTKTRVIALTWVHSVSGVKIPVRKIADMVAEANKGRDEKDRAVLCVDGVHGLGIEDVTLPDLGCDIFMAGTHKWMFGPRGTGLVWARPEGWAATSPTIPDFEFLNTPAAMMSPGGFKPFEHRWAMGEAFKFHTGIGKSRIAKRIHSLNLVLKEGMAKMRHVRLHTPVSPDVSAGIVCFEIDGLSTKQVIDRLLEKRIIGSVAPYVSHYARLAPSLLTDEDDVEAALKELEAMG